MLAEYLKKTWKIKSKGIFLASYPWLFKEQEAVNEPAGEGNIRLAYYLETLNLWSAYEKFSLRPLLKH